jgi:hypothetical protein
MSDLPAETTSPNDPPASRQVRHRRVMFLPILVALIAIWAIVRGFTLSERGRVIERAQSQLENMVATLLDLSVLADRAAQAPAGPNDPDCKAACQIAWKHDPHFAPNHDP